MKILAPISSIMTTRLHTVDGADKLLKVKEIFDTYPIHHVPVARLLWEQDVGGSNPLAPTQSVAIRTPPAFPSLTRSPDADGVLSAGNAATVCARSSAG